MDPDQVEYFRDAVKQAKNGTANGTDVGKNKLHFNQPLLDTTLSFLLQSSFPSQ